MQEGFEYVAGLLWKIIRQIKCALKKPSSPLSADDALFELTEGDIKALIQSWMGSRPAHRNTEVIRFADVGKELSLSGGSTKKCKPPYFNCTTD